MGHDLFFHALLLLGLRWLSMLLYWLWPRSRPTPAKPIKTRSNASKPLQGLTHKPSCDACEHAAQPCHQAPSKARQSFLYLSAELSRLALGPSA
jgi:hypothetical protein